MMGWAMLAIALAVLGWWLRGWVARAKALHAPIQAAVQREMAELEALAADEAFRRAETVIREQAVVQEWPRAIPAEVEARLVTLDRDLAAFLRRYGRVRFSESSTELSAELLVDEGGCPPGSLRVGRTVGDASRALCAEPGRALLREVIDGRVVAEYATIAHYILLAEDPS